MLGKEWWQDISSPLYGEQSCDFTCSFYHDIWKGKGKAVLLQAWSGPEGSRKLRFPDFMTTAQNGG